MGVLSFDCPAYHFFLLRIESTWTPPVRTLYGANFGTFMKPRLRHPTNTPFGESLPATKEKWTEHEFPKGRIRLHLRQQDIWISCPYGGGCQGEIVCINSV